MKKFLLLFLINCFLVSSAQTESAKFVGIPMNQKHTTFVKALLDKGYTYGSGNWDLKGYDYTNLRGTFWHFDDCDIRVKYFLSSDSVASVLVRKQFFTIFKHEVFELMDNLDTKYGPRERIEHNEYQTTYRWYSKDKTFIVELGWFVMSSCGLDFFHVEYFTEKESAIKLNEENKKKKAELDEL